MKVFHLRTQADFEVPDKIFREGGGAAANQWIENLLEVQAAKKVAAEKAQVERELIERNQRDEEERKQKSAEVPLIDRLKQQVEKLQDQNEFLQNKLIESQQRSTSYFDIINGLRAQLEPTEEEKAMADAEADIRKKRVERGKYLLDMIRTGQGDYESLIDLHNGIEEAGPGTVLPEPQIQTERLGGDTEGTEGSGR